MLTDTKKYKSEDANFPSRSSAAKEISLCSQQRLLKAAVKGIRRCPTKEDVQPSHQHPSRAIEIYETAFLSQYVP
jgi:hypothetical protein